MCARKKKGQKRNHAAPKTHHEIHSSPATATTSRWRAIKKPKKTPNPGQFVYCGAYKKRNKKVENAKYFPSVFDAGGCSYQFITFSPVKRPLQRCNRDRYSWISAVLMSAIRRYCRELFIDCFSLPKISGVCEISRKEHEGPSSLLLKAPYRYTSVSYTHLTLPTICSV